jgi:hypothetical protein
MKDGGFRQTLAQQERPVQREFENRLNEAIVAFAEQGLNAVPYYDNKNFSKYVSLVPTSAHTGEGVPDLLMLLIKLTQERMANNLMYISTLQCTVLEVKVIEGLGTTIDVVLVNGYLHEGDKIVLCGLNGAIVTQVRALLTPQPMKELRIKVSHCSKWAGSCCTLFTDILLASQGQYVHHKQIKAAMGVKIVAPDLEKAIAGSRLLVCSEDDDEDELREEVMSDLTNLLNSVDTSGRGVFVQASTLGSLEALLEFLKSDAVKIPVAGINIGPVHRKDVMRCATMLERAPELAVILCFDVAVDKDAERQAEELGVRIFKGGSCPRVYFSSASLLTTWFQQPTLSTTCSISSWRTGRASRRRRSRKLPARQSSPADSTSLLASRSVTVSCALSCRRRSSRVLIRSAPQPSSSDATSLRARCASALPSVSSRPTRRPRSEKSSRSAKCQYPDQLFSAALAPT